MFALAGNLCCLSMRRPLLRALCANARTFFSACSPLLAATRAVPRWPKRSTLPACCCAGCGRCLSAPCPAAVQRRSNEECGCSNRACLLQHTARDHPTEDLVLRHGNGLVPQPGLSQSAQPVEYSLLPGGCPLLCCIKKVTDCIL